jgi:hypothetical protein
MKTGAVDNDCIDRHKIKIARLAPLNHLRGGHVCICNTTIIGIVQTKEDNLEGAGTTRGACSGPHCGALSPPAMVVFKRVEQPPASSPGSQTTSRMGLKSLSEKSTRPCMAAVPSSVALVPAPPVHDVGNMVAFGSCSVQKS